jgi:hypothetical protein
MNDSQTRQSDRAFYLLVTGLLIIIIALLAFLWLRERRAGGDLQQQMAEMELAFKQQRQALGQMLVAEARSQIDRDMLAARTLELDGQPRQALMISAKAAERIGLRPGDVLIVGEAPATRPSPATMPGPTEADEAVDGEESPAR